MPKFDPVLFSIPPEQRFAFIEAIPLKPSRSEEAA
jgi:hypothetical protein